ncbi:MAG: glycerol-3-phosphate 1-O-acyltransferase PlsY [Elusimicrobiaceae bacterium]|nr:glycerol-3-phosphate 1-O-acyltransferase PlsY [Elusimicrobiaceae bacterium]
MLTVNIVIALVLSYFLGAIPSGYLITKKIKGFDIRDYGSGNPGAANVYRIVGKKAGLATFACDAAKGAVAVILAKILSPEVWLPIACGFIAICAHMWTVFLKFRGGKGVATSAGVFGALLPIPTIIAFLSFVIVVWRTGRISPGSILACIVLPLAAWLTGASLPYVIFCIIIAAIVIYKHIPNIKRMLEHKELNFEDGSKKNVK